MLKPGKVLFVPMLIMVVLLAVTGFNQPGLSQGDQSTEEKVAKLEKAIENLRDQIPRIGYINRQEAFTVFPQAAEEKRKKVSQLEKEMKDLQASAQEGEIGESEFKGERDLLKAKHLRARIEVDLAILEAMIEARGFSDITDRLKDLKSQTKPMQETLQSLISDIEDYAVSPDQVSETLNRVEEEQFKKLDDILTNLAQTKVTQVVQQIAQEKDYDLVIERQNVITYRNESGTIDELTGTVKERLKAELRPE